MRVQDKLPVCKKRKQQTRGGTGLEGGRAAYDGSVLCRWVTGPRAACPRFSLAMGVASWALLGAAGAPAIGGVAAAVGRVEHCGPWPLVRQTLGLMDGWPGFPAKGVWATEREWMQAHWRVINGRAQILEVPTCSKRCPGQGLKTVVQRPTSHWRFRLQHGRSWGRRLPIIPAVPQKEGRKTCRQSSLTFAARGVFRNFVFIARPLYLAAGLATRGQPHQLKSPEGELASDALPSRPSACPG